NTDAVVLDADDRLLAKAKVPTTPDVTSGIEAAFGEVVERVDRSRITHAMFGTTHATNAVLQRKGLRRVGVLRLGGPATKAIRPLFGWPQDLRAVISAGELIVDGGIEFDGRELSPLDHDAIARFAADVAGRADAIAITSVFAPVSDEHELAAEQIVRKELGDVPISLSSLIGSLGVLERENATVLNAALTDVAHGVAGAIDGALERHGLRPLTYFAQNDGTLMDLEFANRFPVLTIGSGPANSIRGAAYLTGRSDAIVVDVGGTSTDVGVLVRGFPRESSLGVEIGGIRTNFRMADLVTIALGGGTIVTEDALGPESVGYRITEEALVFGGTTPTLTDAGTAEGRFPFDRTPLAGHELILATAIDRSDRALADAIDRVKTSRDPVPLVAVGGGAPLVPDDLPGSSVVLRPDHSDVANAIGAAIASVSGEVDRVFHGGREAAVAEASREAIERAVAAGAARDGTEVVEIEEVPLAYLTDPAVRIRVKAGGPLAWG
ncbi:MAG TPA: hydantoinase/oxoprolinase family protein, partial [Actinomycetota bacterium]|nr:hydantoinase/oxoprolinase family protein [Actinomycetota bacterium]